METKDYKGLFSHNEIKKLLQVWGLNYNELYCIDSSHGSTDIRLNYIIDKQYVFRINSMGVMTDERLEELNRLIQRYREFSIKAPAFIPYDTDRYVYKYLEYSCYLSEYLDLETANSKKMSPIEAEVFSKNIAKMVAAFAQINKNVDSSNTYSMYSLFDLSPYDIPIDMDEKQENANEMIVLLHELGENGLANKLEETNNTFRYRLMELYPYLNRCIFQGDENDSNLCVDENNEIIGIIDFNMYGSDTCANYLANHALVNFGFGENDIYEMTARQMYEKMRFSVGKVTEVIKSQYIFDENEKEAYALYLGICSMFQWPHRCYYEKYLKNASTRGKIVSLLYILSGEVIIP